jgi:type I restriction enzyme M protein
MLEDFFYIKRGMGEYRQNLEKGITPLVSATNTNNGIIDYVDLDPTFKAPAITIERVSGQAYVQLFPDDITVLVPKVPMSLKKLFYTAAQINMSKWRFSYARKLTPKRLNKILIDYSNFNEIKFDISDEVDVGNFSFRLNIILKS